MLNRHCEFSTSLRPTSLDETGARAPAPLVGAGRGGGSRHTEAIGVIRVGLSGASREALSERPTFLSAARPPMCNRNDG
jgi:hypothetical protein